MARRIAPLEQNALLDTRVVTESLVDRAYSSWLLRAPDEAGRKGWLLDGPQGPRSVAELAQGFLASAEFKALIQPAVIAFKGLNATLPVPQALAPAVAVARQAPAPDVLGEQLLQLLDSPAGEQAPVSNDGYVRSLYQLVLERSDEEIAADPLFQLWVNALDAGATREFVLRGIINSSEAADKNQDDLLAYMLRLLAEQPAAVPPAPPAATPPAANPPPVEPPVVNPPNPAPNQNPTTRPVTLTASNEDTPRTITAAELLVNARDSDGGTLAVSDVQIGGRMLARNLDGTWTFTPTKDDDTNVAFTYTISDGQGGTVQGTATLDLLPVNDAPTGAPTGNLGATDEDTPKTIDTATLLQGFTDVDGDALSVANVVPSAFGQVELQNGNFLITPSKDFNGQITLTYDVIDGKGGVLTGQTRTLNVTPVNDAPVAVSTTVTGLEDSAIPILLKGLDVDGNFLRFIISDRNYLDPTSNVIVPENGILKYVNTGEPVYFGYSLYADDKGEVLLQLTPKFNYFGLQTLTFTPYDTANVDGVEATISINITPVNDAPTGADKAVTIDEDTTYTFTAGDFGFTDPNDTPANDLSEVIVTTVPTRGDLLLNGARVTAGQAIAKTAIDDKKLVWKPIENENGAALGELTFQVRDNGGTANGGVNTDPTPNRITFNVTPVNDAPVASPDTGEMTENETKSFSVLTNDTDVDVGDTKTLVSVGTIAATVPAGIAVDLNAIQATANGNQIQLTLGTAFDALAALQTATLTIPYIMKDGADAPSRSELVITITGENNAAVIGDPPQSAVTEDDDANRDGILTTSGMLSITDPDGVAERAFKTTVANVGTPLGSLNLAASGTYTYSVSNAVVQFLGANKVHVDQFIIESVDGTTKTVSFTINGVNDAAVITGDTTGTVREDGILVAGGTLTVTDPDKDEANFQTPTNLTGSFGAFTITSSGDWTYTLDNAAAQALGANRQVFEGLGVTSIDGATQTISVSIQGANDPATGQPTISDTTPEIGQTLTADTSGIADVDGIPANATFSYQWLANGTAILNATNATYTVRAGDVDKAISVQASFVDAGGTKETVTSNETVLVQAAQPASFLVTTLNDIENPADGVLSLREAIALANLNPDANTITFGASLRGTIHLNDAQRKIEHDLIIDGGGRITIDANADGDNKKDTSITDVNTVERRGFEVSNRGTEVTFKGLTITGGYTFNQNGGGVLGNDGTVLTFEGSTLAGNAAGYGGGVYSAGFLRMLDSTVRNNTASADGGGIYAANGGSLTNVTVNGNTAEGNKGAGGGIYAGETLIGMNLTVSANVSSGATGAGGGMFADGLTLQNATISGNIAHKDTGGITANGAVTISNSILIGNASNQDADSNRVYEGTNIIQAASTTADARFVAGSNERTKLEISDLFISTNEIRLGELIANTGLLANNGGLVQTIALKTGIGNPAIDGSMGVNTLETDARGTPTADGDGNGSVIRDLGAYELVPPVAPPVGPQPPPPPAAPGRQPTGEEKLLVDGRVREDLGFDVVVRPRVDAGATAEAGTVFVARDVANPTISQDALNLRSLALPEFSPDTSRLDFSNLDASFSAEGLQRFLLVQNFSNRAGELRIDADRLFADRDGDGVADFVLTTGVQLTPDMLIL